LLQREYIPYFRRVLGERSKKRPKRSKGKKGEHQGKKEYPQGFEKRGEGYIEEEKYGVSFSVENIFFICKMMREIAIITITEASNNERSVLRAEGILEEGKCFRNTL